MIIFICFVLVFVLFHVWFLYYDRQMFRNHDTLIKSYEEQERVIEEELKSISPDDPQYENKKNQLCAISVARWSAVKSLD